jgi:hypothetical protein
VEVSAAKHHSAALTDKGEVYTWYVHYPPSTSTSVYSHVPSTLLPPPPHSSSTLTHSPLPLTLLPIDHRGHGRGGRLGHGDETPRMFPERVACLEGIVITRLSASENHTAALSTHGDVYTWGSDRSDRPYTTYIWLMGGKGDPKHLPVLGLGQSLVA